MKYSVIHFVSLCMSLAVGEYANQGRSGLGEFYGELLKRMVPESSAVSDKRIVPLPYSGGIYGKRVGNAMHNNKMFMLPSHQFSLSMKLPIDDTNLDDYYAVERNEPKYINRPQIRSLPMSGGLYG